MTKSTRSSKRPIAQYEHEGKKTVNDPHWAWSRPIPIRTRARRPIPAIRTLPRRAHGWIAGKIADDRGIENLKVVRLD